MNTYSYPIDPTMVYDRRWYGTMVQYGGTVERYDGTVQCYSGTVRWYGTVILLYYRVEQWHLTMVQKLCEIRSLYSNG